MVDQKSLNEIFDQYIAKLRKFPKSKETLELIKELEKIKRSLNLLLHSLSTSHSNINEPYVPAGYRLPTKEEHIFLNSIYKKIDNLRNMIKQADGMEKKKLIKERRDLNRIMIEYMESRKIYFTPGSNNFIK